MSQPTNAADSGRLRDPARRPLLTFGRKRLREWRVRHLHPFNFAIHLIGIPLAVAGVFLFFLTDWYWGAAAFVLGYLLQYVGHAVEGNDLGEWAGIKRLLGLSYAGISPRFREEAQKRLARD